MDPDQPTERCPTCGQPADSKHVLTCVPAGRCEFCGAALTDEYCAKCLADLDQWYQLLKPTFLGFA